MAFSVADLHLVSFRNYEDLTLHLDPSLTILWGKNAVGKTSAIEAIQLLCEGTSFRRSPYPEMIHHSHERAVLELEARDSDFNPVRTRTVRAVIEPTTKTHFVNGKEVSVVDGIAGVIPVVTFSPDNLRLIKDSASRRRGEVDALGKQLSKNYARICTEYTKTLKGRNRLLVDGYCTDPAFDAWTDQLALLGSALTRHRARLIARLSDLSARRYRAIDDTATLTTHYANNWGAPLDEDAGTLTEHLRSALEEDLPDDVCRRSTQLGPHRDEIIFSLDGHDARAFASQGQQRMIALAFKLAGADLIKEVLDTDPILLLDDVMSELDEDRRVALVSQVGSQGQTVITTTNTHYFEAGLLKRARIIEIGGHGEASHA